MLAPAHAGGLERVVHALAIGQQRMGHHVVAAPIVDAWPADHSFAAPLVRENVEVRPLIFPARAYRRERSALAALFRDVVPDVVHSHGYHSDVVGGRVARRAGIATVSTAHGFTRGPWRNRLYEHLDRIALRKFDAVAAVSRPLAEELLRSGLLADRVHVVPNAWSRIATPLDRSIARRELGLAAVQFVVGWVGRMTHEKGLDVLVDALGMLADLPLHACVVGAGPERVPQQSRASGMGARIHWAGPIREAGRYFSAFDVLAVSSRTEGVPMVVLESMAAGVPLVATAVGGIPDVVSSREAILVPAERPDALAAALRSVFMERSGAANRATAALARLEREFAEKPWLDRYQDVYRAACDTASRRHRAGVR